MSINYFLILFKKKLEQYLSSSYTVKKILFLPPFATLSFCSHLPHTQGHYQSAFEGRVVTEIREGYLD